MTAVKITIERLTNEAFPGWVECSLRDSDGQVWRFIEKLPATPASPGELNRHPGKRRLLSLRFN